jgi:hypothetical protein
MSDMGMYAVNLNELLNKRTLLIKKLSSLKYILRGTIVKQGNVCGKAVCICKRKNNPILHGPYNYLSNRSRKSINTIFLTKIKLPYAKKGILEYNKAIEIIYQIAEINFNILRYHHARLPDE